VSAQACETHIGKSNQQQAEQQRNRITPHGQRWTTTRGFEDKGNNGQAPKPTPRAGPDATPEKNVLQ